MAGFLHVAIHGYGRGRGVPFEDCIRVMLRESLYLNLVKFLISQMTNPRNGWENNTKTGSPGMQGCLLTIY